MAQVIMASWLTVRCFNKPPLSARRCSICYSPKPVMAPRFRVSSHSAARMIA
jgi:hypothetical protein